MLDVNDPLLGDSKSPDKGVSGKPSQEIADLSYMGLLDGSYEFRGYQFSANEVSNFSLGAHTHRINIAKLLSEEESEDKDARLEYNNPRNQALSDLIQLLELDNSREDDSAEPEIDQPDISRWGHDAWENPVPGGFSASPVPADYNGDKPRDAFDPANMKNDLAGFILYYVGRKLNRMQPEDTWYPDRYGKSFYHQQDRNPPQPLRPSPGAEPAAPGSFDPDRGINLEPGQLEVILKKSDQPINNTRALTWQHGEAEAASPGAMTMFGEGSAEYRADNELENSLLLAPSDVEKRVNAFMERFLTLKRHPESEKNDSLQMGLDILEQMIETDPESLLSLDSADRPEIIAKMVRTFVETEWDGTMSIIRNHHQEGYQASEAFAERNIIKTNSDRDLTRDKDRYRKLQQAYLTQMTIFALHMLIYEYQCVNRASFSGSNQQSALVVTTNASFVRVSPSADGHSLREVYEKIALRDHEAAKKALEEVIHDPSPFHHFYNQVGENLRMSNIYTPTLILATKSGEISPAEEKFSAQTFQATWQNGGEPLL